MDTARQSPIASAHWRRLRAIPVGHQGERRIYLLTHSCSVHGLVAVPMTDGQWTMKGGEDRRCDTSLDGRKEGRICAERATQVIDGAADGAISYKFRAGV